MDGRQRPWWLWALAGLVALAALAGIILAVWKLPSLLYGDVSKASADARLQAASGFRTALVAGLAGLAAPGGLAMATRTYRLTQQGQITDRYTKAIDQLGSDKPETRLGGIYALERIAVDSERDHRTVVEVLGAFAREQGGQPPPHNNADPATVERGATDPGQPGLSGLKPPEGALFPSQVLARNVGAVRRLTGWTQALVAERMNNLGHRWTAATLSEVERGYRNVTTDELVNLALVLGRTVERLLDARVGRALGPFFDEGVTAIRPTPGETRVALVNAASEVFTVEPAVPAAIVRGGNLEVRWDNIGRLTDLELKDAEQ